ncbi:NAD(P)-dependent iron-only hydrogenase diaphorase component iron-sulfur protein [Anaerovirgula multivorans]|uniref:NAD(P)-dependent iron-only hydrogenase diaphorase component iron-sulfur protein n=1 Tax=Anaerovirgula multivorans TaxID=312168 RepID=A0A239HL13_9FIRM|nr:NAD(P)H-dependent oxidoreductase subunit E [Anaerovirgula multivorans]SNS82002.1 NAD(P)-dependent iron-only hydrogenase diaphorase component iron-sulfur protein [Anaerovirgula multivorans]
MPEELRVKGKNNNEKPIPKEHYEELERYIDSLPSLEGRLIQVLHRAQDIFGYLPRDVQLFIARRLGLAGAKVNGVVTFYTYFTEEPRGEYVINICTGTACFVKGGNKLLEEFENKLKVSVGDTTEDRKFTLKDVRCVGACGLAPLVVINDKVYGRVKPEEVEGILSEYRQEVLQ